MASKKSSGRELIDTGNNKLFMRRDERGRFKSAVDVGTSLGRDVRLHAKTTAKKGQGDRGDQSRG